MGKSRRNLRAQESLATSPETTNYPSSEDSDASDVQSPSREDTSVIPQKMEATVCGFTCSSCLAPCRLFLC